MIGVRVIPCLLLKGKGLVKTVKFKDPKYLGDPRNAVKIFNDKEVDELIILDIGATDENRVPDFDLLCEIVSEAFMPVAYGGGIREIEDIRRLFKVGIEKAVICTYAVKDNQLIREASKTFGRQSIVVCIDVKKTLCGRYEVYLHGARENAKIDPVIFAKQVEENGAGEILINSIDRDGTMEGYDLELIKSVAQSVNVPVIACGGASRVEDFRRAVIEGGASGVAAGSVFLFHGRYRAVLINYPTQGELKELFS